LKHNFTDTDLKAIEKAVETLESSYPVELVPMFANQSNNYPIAYFRALGVAVLTAYLGLVLANLWLGFDWFPFYLQGLILIFWCALLCFLVDVFDGFKKILLSKRELEETSFSQAQQAFYNQQVNTNPDRFGILIYVSYFEQNFHIICDQKTAKIIPNQDWDVIGKEFTNQMKSRLGAQAVVSLITNCGKILEKHKLASNQLPPSILPNNLRT
jgi:putative membrane protein